MTTNKHIAGLIKCVAKLFGRFTLKTRQLFSWPNVVVYDRPTRRDIHLNSIAAIRIWLAMVDRPLLQANPQANELGVQTNESRGQSGEEGVGRASRELE